MKRTRIGFYGVILAIAVFLAGGEFSHASEEMPPPGVTPELLEQGKKLYTEDCAVCHGTEGKGDGTGAYLLFPKPRNFTDGIFKVRSTPTGELPRDVDLYRTISEGMPGSAMSSFVSRTEAERWALTYYVLEMADIREEPERVIQVPPEPPATPEALAEGKALYTTFKCWECHGDEGRGDGPSAATSRDDWGYPNPPNDFTRGIYKGGGENEDIYLRFTTGMDGATMPSYEDSASEEQRWALVHYLKSLAGQKVAAQPGTGTITARKVTGSFSLNPTHPLWDDAPASQIPVMLLWQRQQAADTVSVKAAHNGSEIAFLLEWEDWEPAARFIRHQDYTDGAAIQFSLSAEPPHFTMGEKDGTTNLWYWRADRQMDLARFQDVEDVYPRVVADDYQFAKDRYPKDIERPGHLAVLSVPAHDPLYLAGVSVGNLVSTWRTSAVEDLNAEGFGTLTAQKKQEQNVTGQGFWLNGVWKVVFVRSLKSEDPLDVQLAPGAQTPVAFAVWDGSQGDRDGQKAVTTWYDLRLDEE